MHENERLREETEQRSDNGSSREGRLRQQLEKRRSAEARALKVVLALIECNVSKDFFIQAAIHINVDYYSDVTVERSIVLICGYPLCDNRLINVSKQKYHISLRQKKVYDLTERRNFCSSHCFNASKYYEAQLPSSPLWLRADECNPPLPVLFGDFDRVATTAVGQQAAHDASVVVDARDIAVGLHELALLEHTDDKATADRSDVSVQTRSGAVSTPSCLGDVTSVLIPIPVDKTASAAMTACLPSTGKAGRVPSAARAPVAIKQRGIADTVQPHQANISRVEVTPQTPVQVAIARLLEWSTVATSAWAVALYNDKQEDSCSHVSPPADMQAVVNTTMSVSGASLPSEIEAAVHPHDEGKLILTDDTKQQQTNEELYASQAVEFLRRGQPQKAGTLSNESNESSDAGEGRWVPASEAVSQPSIRRKIVIEKLSKSLYRAEAIVSSDVCSTIRRQLVGICATFRLTKDNLTLEPTEWTIVSLLLACIMLRHDQKKSHEIQAVIGQLGCTAHDLVKFIDAFFKAK